MMNCWKPTNWILLWASLGFEHREQEGIRIDLGWDPVLGLWACTEIPSHSCGMHKNPRPWTCCQPWDRRAAGNWDSGESSQGCLFLQEIPCGCHRQGPTWAHSEWKVNLLRKAMDHLKIYCMNNSMYAFNSSLPNTLALLFLPRFDLQVGQGITVMWMFWFSPAHTVWSQTLSIFPLFSSHTEAAALVWD